MALERRKTSFGAADLGGAAALRSTAWLFLAQIASSGIGFLVWAMVARRLGTLVYGSTQLGTAIGTYLALIATIGLTPLGILQFGGQPDARRHVLRLNAYRVLHSLVVTSLLGLLSVLISRHLPPVVVLCATAVVIRQLWPEWVDISLDGTRRVAVERSVYFIVLLPAVILYVRGSSAGTAFGMSLCLSAATVGAAAWYFSLRQLPRKAARPRAKVGFAGWLSTMRVASALGVGDVLGQLLANADVLLLALLGGKVDVALYGAAYRIVFAVQALGVAMRHVSLKVLARQRLNEHPGAFEANLVRIVINSAAVLSAIATIVAPVAVRLAFGDGFRGSARLLAVLAWTWPTEFAGAVVLNMLIVLGRRKEYVYAMLIPAACNILGNLVVIPIWGALGAAINIVVCLSVLLLVAVRFVLSKSMVACLRRGALPATLWMFGMAGSLIGALHSRGLGDSVECIVGVVALTGLVRQIGRGLSRVHRASVT